MIRSMGKWAVGGVAVLGIMGTTFANTSAMAAAAPSVSLSETGSSLLYPLFNGEWIPAYKSVASNVTVSAASTGSGAGISQAIQGTVQIGASDAYMADSQLSTAPGILNIPLAISAQQIMYHLPGVPKSKHLHLTGQVLAGIYTGAITKWNDSRIAKLNKGIKLPNQTIIPIVRSDGSGDTFLFTQFLSDTDKSWLQKFAYGTSVSWAPVQGEIGAKGNSGIVDALQQNPYSISYVGISYANQAAKAGLGYAALKNKAGKFVLPTKANIESSATQMVKQTPKDGRISLIFAPGKASYPIINYEYAIVNKKQKDANTATAVHNFLDWAISSTGGNKLKYLSVVHFLPLPVKVQAIAKAEIAQIGK